MANDINNATGGAGTVTGDITYGRPVVQAPMKTFGTNNVVDDDTSYNAHTRTYNVHPYGIHKIKDKYDARFDDPTYYSA